MQSSKAIGEASEAVTIARFLLAGLVVLKPFGDNQRYDVVLDVDGTFFRIQCKTGRIKKGSILFSTCSSYVHRGRGKVDYRGQAEYFAVYVHQLSKLFLVPVADVGRREGSLRLEAAKNGQQKNVRWASAYEFVDSFPLPEVSHGVA